MLYGIPVPCVRIAIAFLMSTVVCGAKPCMAAVPLLD